jgi:hypothetical protein
MGDGSYGGDGGPATAASLGADHVAVDGLGNLYISGNFRIRKVMTDGLIRTVAGRARNGFDGDGQATDALLYRPTDVAVDGAGSLYIVDYGNNRIRKVTSDGIITTVAGNGNYGYSGDGGPATSAAVGWPTSVAVDTGGNLYIATATGEGNHRVRKVTPAGIITTVAGNGNYGYSGDGGPAIQAMISVSGIAVDTAGNLYIAGSSRVRKVTPAGIITTIAGNGSQGYTGDGGPATQASFFGPYKVAVDQAGNLYVLDFSSVRKVTSAGIITTVAGSELSGYGGDGGPATSAKLDNASGIALDTAGNIYIGDTFNGRIRRVSPAGLITTIAGNGVYGRGGDGGPATSASLASPQGVAVDTAGNLFIADTLNDRIRRVVLIQTSIQSSLSFSITDRGGVSATTAGSQPATRTGFAVIRSEAGSTTPAGIAILGRRERNVLVSETSVPATPLYRSVRIYAEVNGPVNTGIAIVNPNNQPATVTSYFTGPDGDYGRFTMEIPANNRIARFLNEEPFNSGTLINGAFTMQSSIPISVIALRGLTNERNEFLMTTLPVTDLNAPLIPGAVIFPEFADGGGWRTQVILVNPTDTPLSGQVAFVSPSGLVTVNGQFGSTFSYSIPAHSSQNLKTAGNNPTTTVGWVIAIPANNTAAPSGLVLFSMRSNGVTVTEAGAIARYPGRAFRLYAETAGSFGAPGSIQSGIAMVNPSSAPVPVTLELSRLNGSSTGLTATINLPPGQQTQLFLFQIREFASLPPSFKGILRVASPGEIFLTGVRSRYNERGDFLISTTPPVDEGYPTNSFPLYFPQIADSGGYTTQFILFTNAPGQTSQGSLQLYTATGAALALPFQ